MTLSALRALVLKGLSVYNADAYTGGALDEYGQQIDEFLNQGYALVCAERYRPQRTEAVGVTDKSFPLTALSADVLTITSVRGVCGLEFSYVADEGTVTVPCLPDAAPQVVVTYAYAPERMTRDTDVPIFTPEIQHGILAAYALSQMFAYLYGASSDKSSFQRQLFADGLRLVQPQAQGRNPAILKNIYNPL